MVVTTISTSLNPLKKVNSERVSSVRPFGIEIKLVLVIYHYTVKLVAIITLTSDRSIKHKQRPSRPQQQERERHHIITSIDIFRYSHPEALQEALPSTEAVEPAYTVPSTPCRRTEVVFALHKKKHSNSKRSTQEARRSTRTRTRRRST